MSKELTMCSLFDGSGTFCVAGKLAGITPVSSSEIEPFPLRVTEVRLPEVKQLGNVSNIKGDEIEPVDIITFGSPCQDMSVAGKRAGLDGERSGLFYEAVRIIKEMRDKTNGEYPKYAVWENVCGAFSSNQGDDFRCVLETMCKICDSTITVPKSDKWQHSGLIMGRDYSVGWRQFDSQYWGVPQRRKRIYLVADFRGKRAGKILFEQESVSRYFEESFRSWKDFTKTSTDSTRTTDTTVNIAFENHGQDTRYTELHDIMPTVTSTYGMGGNNQPFVVRESPTAYGICGKYSNSMLSDNPNSGFYEAETSRTIDTSNQSPNKNQGGMAVVESENPTTQIIKETFDVRFTSEGIKVVSGNCYQSNTARTLDTGGNAPDSNQGGIAVVSAEMDNLPCFWNGEQICSTLTCHNANGSQRMPDIEHFNCVIDKVSCELSNESNDIVYSISRTAYNCSRNWSAKMNLDINDKGVNSTLIARGPSAVSYNVLPYPNIKYIVRRLTPKECAKLQGMPTWWCDNLNDSNPTDEEIQKWSDYFNEFNIAIGKDIKPKSRTQIVKWLNDPYSDSAEYKMWGNGIALPNALYILCGIKWVESENIEDNMGKQTVCINL